MHVAFKTFGCKINSYDTQAIRESILDLGYCEVKDSESADVYVINSCTVTAKAGEKSVHAARKLLRRNPEAKVIVTGCMTEEDRLQLGEIDGLFHVIGNEEKDQIPALLQGGQLGEQDFSNRASRRRSRNIFNLSSSRFEGRTRAFLKVHDGCDDFCTYCIIPFLRGKSKSREIGDVMAEAARMAASGHRELVITGVHLSRYGRDLDEGVTLTQLLRSLREIEGVDRVRLSSIGEGAFSDELIALFKSDPGMCNFFHIPLQSGSNSVLDRMKRGYTKEEFLSAVERVRSSLPDAMISTDCMIGFPGESQEEFEESMETCRLAGFESMHLFPYSYRAGTKAAQMKGHVTPDVVQDRMKIARKVESELSQQGWQARVGQEMDVLIEKQDDGLIQGLSREGFLVRADLESSNSSGLAEMQLRNREVRVRVSDFDAKGLRGQLLALSSDLPRS